MRISVVIPCYNKEPFLEETLRSVVSQTYAPSEIIVIDDGSTDESARVARQFPQVHVLQQPNAGMSAARNRGIREASGDWIALLDADDVWQPEKLHEQVHALATAPDGTVCVYTDIYHLRDGQRVEPPPRPEHHASEPFLVDMLLEWTVTSSAPLIRRDAALKTRFPEQYRDSEDVIFFALLRTLGPFVRVAKPLTGYRRGHEQQTRDPRHMYRSVLARHEWFERHADELAVADSERDRFGRSLAEQLIATHDHARWVTRDVALARDCRRLFRRVHPEPNAAPSSFKSILLPAWVYLLRDRLDGWMTRS